MKQILQGWARVRPDLHKNILEFLLRLVPKKFSEPPKQEQDPSRVLNRCFRGNKKSGNIKNHEMKFAYF